MELIRSFFQSQEASRGKNICKDFMLIVFQYVKSGRERFIELSVTHDLWTRIQTGYQRLILWLRATAPQLKIESWYGAWAMSFCNTLAPPNTKLLGFNCGI